MNWRETQQAFAEAVRDPERAVPAAVGPRSELAPTRRFNVYRNNSTVSLTEAVGETFPVVRELVGEEFFAAMARAYVAEHLPDSPVMLEYGGTFAGFIEGFEPARSLPFLADVARVEWAWVRAYHAEDAPSIEAGVLQGIADEALSSARLRLHPTVQLIRSNWPAVSIWGAHQISDPAERQAALGAIAQEAECGLIVRPELDVQALRVSPAILQLLTSLRDGATLGIAIERLDEGDAEEFGSMLGFIFSTGAIAALDVADDQYDRRK